VYRSGKQAYIICKGSPESMLKIIGFKNDEKAKIEAKLAQYKVEGVQPIIYAKKALSVAEMAAYES
jgi:magnesium-transporting ATPase (P-type)